MNPAEREKVIRAALESAVAGLNQSDVSEDKVQALLRISPETNVLTTRSSETRVKIDTVFGSAMFIKESGPSWVEYKDHRRIDEWQWILKQGEQRAQQGVDAPSATEEE